MRNDADWFEPVRNARVVRHAPQTDCGRLDQPVRERG